ncbi:translation initiation factor IF-2-like [Cervus elaphus]|uniref:translation initiation factor IF-2-like n=1 Tax=Cervus canadensis TaxID=1574408 RepID=UPI001CA3576F|nr:translation initiation factor IF-2-like [Cervus canadensis]XP_043308224.1 translation initiation factor IF-2-like [Cervus canadensis]XP_043726823.1 translation initiation factor IF-2-like [Cervus elaphus]XP_043726832.1 translation initiation factor IF-2-like [Cervus elaphus]
MAAAPRRGWSRGGGRAPSRGSRRGALRAQASALEGGRAKRPRSWPGRGPRPRRSGPKRGGSQETAESRPRRGPTPLGVGGPRMEAGKRGVAPRSSLAFALAGLGVADAAPDTLAGTRRQRTLTPSEVSGTWGRAPPRLGSAGADPACEPRDASEPPGPGKRRKGAREKQPGARQPGVLPRGPAGGAGAFFACGWSPTTKAIPRDPNYRVREAVQGLIISRCAQKKSHVRTQ